MTGTWMPTAGALVHYSPIIGETHDGKVYTVKCLGELAGRQVAWLHGKSGCVAIEAISPASAEAPAFALRLKTGQWVGIWNDKGTAEHMRARYRDGDKYEIVTFGETILPPLPPPLPGAPSEPMCWERDGRSLHLHFVTALDANLYADYLREQAGDPPERKA